MKVKQIILDLLRRKDIDVIALSKTASGTGIGQDACEVLALAGYSRQSNL